MMELLVEERMDIRADRAAVWAIVRRTGWWLNDGEIDPIFLRRDDAAEFAVAIEDGAHSVVTRVEVDAGRRVLFLWGTRQDGEDSYEHGVTRVEVTISPEPTDTGMTEVVVAERGFESLGFDDAQRAQAVRENSEGWRIELNALRRHLEGTSTAPAPEPTD